MPDLGERIALLEGKVDTLVDESQRSRDRLHKLEGTTAAFKALWSERDREASVRQRRLELRMQILTVTVAFAGVVAPLFYAGVIK